MVWVMEFDSRDGGVKPECLIMRGSKLTDIAA